MTNHYIQLLELSKNLIEKIDDGQDIERADWDRLIEIQCKFSDGLFDIKFSLGPTRHLLAVRRQRFDPSASSAIAWEETLCERINRLDDMNDAARVFISLIPKLDDPHSLLTEIELLKLAHGGTA